MVWGWCRAAEAVRRQLPTNLSQRTAALLFGCCPEAASVSACAYPVTPHPEGWFVWGAPATPGQPRVGGGVGVASSSSRGARTLCCQVSPPCSTCLGSPLRTLATEVVSVRCHAVRTSPKLVAAVPAAIPPRCDRARRLRHGAEAPWQVELGGGPRFAVRPPEGGAPRRVLAPLALHSTEVCWRTAPFPPGGGSGTPGSSPELLRPRLAEAP
jgi:hypothetical protein